MKWLELSVSAPPEFVEPLSHIFYRYGHGGVALEQEGGFNPDEGETPSETAWVTLKTYLPINDSTDERRNRIDVGVRLVAHVGPVTELMARTVDEDEWQNSWKDHFHVLRVGRRLVVKPTWREYEPEHDDVVIVLDPGMAFGTGHHPTTRSCLEALERLVEPGASVLDFGCGSGILSIAASKLGASSVLGVEADSSAVRVAKQNARENRVEHNVRVLEGTLPRPEARAGEFDLAVANISAKVVSEAAGELVSAVKRGGYVIASGIIADNRAIVESAMAAAGAALTDDIVDGDWVTLVYAVGGLSAGRRA